jgi:hypothetical protein
VGEENDKQAYIRGTGLSSVVQKGIFYHVTACGVVTQDFLVHEVKSEGDISTENSIISIKALSYDESVYPSWEVINHSNGLELNV